MRHEESYFFQRLYKNELFASHIPATSLEGLRVPNRDGHWRVEPAILPCGGNPSASKVISRGCASDMRITALVRSIVETIWPLLAALLLTCLLLLLLGEPVGAFVRLLFEGSWGSPRDRCTVLTKTMPLILTGLAVAIPYRAGLFNIGGEGQMFAGGLAAAYAGSSVSAALGLPSIAAIPFCLLSGILAGAAWAFFPAILRTYRGVHEVLTTIIFNFLAFYIVNYIIQGPLSAGEGLAQTSHLDERAMLPVLWRVRIQALSSGILISALVAAAASGYLHRIRWGRISTLVGRNPAACRYAGVNTGRHWLTALLLGGAIAGLGGALDVCGVHGYLQARFAPGYGFDGIAVAFLARAEPWACIPSALAIASLRTAGQTLQLELDISKDIVLILEAILVAGVAIQIAWSRRAMMAGSQPDGGEKQ